MMTMMMTSCVTTDLVPVDDVVVFDSVDLGHREGHGEAHDGYGEGLHGAPAHHVDVGRDGGLVPAAVAHTGQ